MTDAFLAARPEYRRAMNLAARPMPILAGEVAEIRRRVPFRQSFGGSILIGLAGVMVFCGLIWTLAEALS